MKRISALLIALMMVWGFSGQAQAALILRGTDTLGYRLIYDDDLDITWYDYTNPWDTWQNQVDWASALTVDFYGLTYDDWRLPATVDGPYVYGTDGTTMGGYNITSSEMGHLYYTELRNLGYHATSGVYQPGYGLNNTSDFQDLAASYYWSGTGYSDSTGSTWFFNFAYGSQYPINKDYSSYGLAVRPGNVVIPEPATLLLLGTGLTGLLVRRKKLKS